MFLLPNITHPASSMESYLVMTTAWSKRSPWTEVCYLCLNLLQAGVTGELTACHDRHSVRFGKRWQKLCQKLKSWQQIRSDRRTSLPVDGIFFSALYLCHQLTCDPNTKRIFLPDAAADDWPPYDKISEGGFDLWPDPHLRPLVCLSCPF